ncbi:hypothetical protein [Aureivirga sp. CE67]|uniref:hypothetical protein n=1 Tax=Aureivirga sp. CE67 TaxID=1788983 RepID=UPI0018CBA08A|nr:hypothetical protein [Aureivirga sp. CE67]
MGMYYFFETNNNYKSEKQFPYVLSYFFEQIGGYDDKSVIVQLEKILEIDFSIFQNTYFDDADFEFDEFLDEETRKSIENSKNVNWIKIEEIQNVVLEFIEKSKIAKDYFSKVIFSTDEDDEKLRGMNYSESLKYEEENPNCFYPVNNSILSKENIENGFLEINEIMNEFKNNEVKELRLRYD